MSSTCTNLAKDESMEKLFFVSRKSIGDADYELAKEESLGFFGDVPSDTWIRLKQKVQDMSPNFNTKYLPHTDENGVRKPNGRVWYAKAQYFYQNHVS